MATGSTDKDIIHQGNSIITVETLPDYPHPVVVKKPSGHVSSRRNDRYLENEYEMTRTLSETEGVRRVLEQSFTDNQPELILEYIDGQTLQDHINGKRLILRSRLKIAVDLTRILAKIHEQNVIHLDLGSRNILIGSKGSTLHFIDLSAASRIDGNVLHKIQPEQAMGNLQYISPEQTGRINRTVDERSDLYSLGVVLYELMTRQLPFDSKYPTEIIHHHIARTPVPPAVLSSDIPEVISTIIMKLLSKDPEDRYQSADGVRADLEKCLQGLGPGNTIETFPVGEADHASRFRYPEKLYGRKEELQILLDAFKSACRQTSSMIFVSGYSGIGKTVLVDEIQRPVSEKHGYFIKGKFDQYLRTTPYSGITQAFDDFVSRVLAEPEEEFNKWRDKIRSAVGELGKVITEIIPALEDLIGAQPKVPVLGGQEAENRFNYVFINFLLAVATEKYPLVLFIDDMQWIDAASLRLLKVIQSDFDRPGLLVVGAYRDNEVDASHPLMGIVGDQEKEGMQLEILNLDNLQQRHIKTLLSDTLGTRKGIKELGAAIYEKTRGNPFFIRRLLASLNTEGHIIYDPETNSWKWDVEEIKTEAISDNVADLLARTITNLPEEVKDILKLAACIGNRFEVPTIALVSGLAERDVIRSLTLSSIGQYVFKLGDTYEFVHDQVQQAAYNLIDAKNRTSKHLKIGRLLLADTKETELEERIFDIVTHYNLGADSLTDQAEKIQVAKLNLIAGRKAKGSSAFSASAEYLELSTSLLGENKWQDNYQLTMDVHCELIDTYYLNNQSKEVENLFKTIIEHANKDIDASVAYQKMISLKIGQNETGEAISIAEEFLERLHISFDQAIDSDLSVDELYELPDMKDPEKLVALDILATLTTPIKFSAPERLPSLIYTMLNIISHHGNSDVSSTAYSWHALILCVMKQYREGNLFGQLGVDLLGKYPASGMASKTMNTQCAWIGHWKQSVHDLIAPLKKYHLIGMQEGQIEWGLYSLLNYTLLLWGTGKPLNVYISEVEPSIELCEHKHHEPTLTIFLLFAESVRNLTGKSGKTTRLEGKWFSEEKMMPRLESRHLLLALYGLLKITLCYLFGDPQEAYQHIEETLKYRDSLNPHYLYTKISFYGGLSCITGLAGAEDDADRQERLKKLNLFEEELKLWAEVAPMNYQHQHHLLMAEKFRVTKKPWKAVQFFEKAIQGAQENQFVHDEALANELFGQFWLEQSNDSIAQMYMREARVLYQQWGAEAKVRHLENSYPQYFKTPTTPSGQPDTTRTAHTTTDNYITPIQMDLDSIISVSQMLSASQALSSKTDLDQLLIKMMELVMTISGAEKAVLLLRQEENWFVQALSDISSKKHDILLNQPFDTSGSDSETDHVPVAVFQFCQRSKEALVVGDAALDQRFAGARTVKAHGIRSIACIPVLGHGELRGMLYLENRHMADVFTQERVEILTHMSSQFGVSVENALLYDRLSRKVRELQVSEERYTLAVAGSAAGLWDWDIPCNELYVSDRLLELLGFAPNEILFTMDEFWSRLHPDDLPVVRRAIDAHLENRLPFHIECRLQTRSGEYWWFLARGQALWSETGKTIRMSGSLTDINQRKRAEEELMQSEERFRKLMEQSPIAIELLDPEGQILQINTAWLRLWDVNEEEAAQVLENYNMLTDDQIEDLGIMPLVERAFAGESIVLPPIAYDANITSEEIGLEGMDTRAPWIQCHLYSVRNANGDIVYVVNTYMDLTDLRQAEQEAQEQRETLARMDRTTRMGQLAGSIAHELNQPLTGILSTAQAGEIMTRRGQYEKDEMAEVLAAIAADAKRAGRVIHSLRELYHDQKRDLEPINVDDVIGETIQLLRSELIKLHVQVTTQCAPSVPMMKGNRVQIQQVLINLIMNSNQAMSGLAHEDRHLHVETACDEKEVRVWVEDSGPGIDEDKIDHIFEPLTTWKSGGTGMGLAMSQSIIRTHQGNMWAENRPEGGARVGFTLSLLKEEPQT